MSLSSIFPLSLHDALPIYHISNDLEVSMSGTGMTGISEQAFGVDNIALDLETVPPERFEVSVPTTISEETGAGAGKLETEVSRSEEHTSELQSRGHIVCRL